MKESIERIKAWAQKHPYLAAAILLGVGLLAYLAIKRGGGGGGFGGNGSEAAPEPSPTGETGLPLGLGSGGDNGTSGGGFQPVETSPEQTSPAGLEVYTPGPMKYPTIPEISPSGYPMLDGSPITSPSMSMLVSSSTGQAVTNEPKAQSMAPKVTSAKVSGLDPKAQSAAKSKPINKGSVSVVGFDPKKASQGLPQTTQTQKDGQTPAQKLGKGKYFTGYYNGVYYVLGYPRVVSASGTIGTNSGGKKPTQTGGGKKGGR